VNEYEPFWKIALTLLSLALFCWVLMLVAVRYAISHYEPDPIRTDIGAACTVWKNQTTQECE